MNNAMISKLLFLIGTGVASFAFAQGGSGATPPPKPIRTTVKINAHPQKVWEVLTTPELIKQWFLGVETITTWKPGSPLVHRGEYNGKPYESKGVILEIEEPKVLAHSHWSAMSGLPDLQENYQIVRYDLAPNGSGTDLTLTEENIPDLEKRKISEQTWQKVLANLKAIAEKE